MAQSTSEKEPAQSNSEIVLADFSVEERFLKLPIKKLLALEGIEPIAPQIEMINAIENPDYRFVVACLSRRTGKTYMAGTISFLKAMEPNSNVLVVSPNYSLTNISWMLILEKLNFHGIEIASKNKTDKEIHLENGSMLKFGSSANANALVGRSYDLIVYDEAALDHKGMDSFNVQLRPTLDRPNSKVIFISTPRGLNWFHDFYMRGEDEKFPNWFSIHSTWESNPRMTAEDVAEARLGMSKAEFSQEYEALFTVFEGQIYEGFDQDKHVEDLTGRAWSDKYRYESIMSIDPGYKDATGAVTLKYDTDEDHFYLVWDYQEAERTTDQHAAVFSEKYEKYDVDMIFVDSAAAQFRQDLAVLYDLPSTKAKKSVLDGIAYCQSIVESGRLTVCSSCTHAIMMLINYRWDPSPNLNKPKPVHDCYSHVADAFRYALYTYRR